LAGANKTGGCAGSGPANSATDYRELLLQTDDCWLDQSDRIVGRTL